MIDSFTGKYRFLSNFYKDEDGFCVENAFQAFKTEDPLLQKAILSCFSPAEAKKMGKRAKLRSDWEDIKLDVMLTLVRRKFERNTSLAYKLIETNDSVLVEGNWWGDTYWGVCKGVGENHLGKILMQVRRELRN